MQGRTRWGAAAAAAVALTAAAAMPAAAIEAGETVVASALPMPAGALSGAGESGLERTGPGRVAVSGSGRFVAFASHADGLDPALPRHVLGIFRKDRLTGAVTLVSRADGAAGAPATSPGGEVRISDDGDRVAWVTRAALVPADDDGGRADVYVRDVGDGTTTLATAGAIDAVEDHDLSGDGAWVAFATTTALAGADDAGGRSDVYRRRLADGATTLVSRSAIGPGNAGGAAHSPSISDSGAWVAFVSDGADVVGGFTGATGGGNVYVRDMGAGRSHLVSSVAGQPTAGAGGSSDPQLAGAPASGNLGGVKLAFVSRATSLDAADGSARDSVFRRQLSDDRARLVSDGQLAAEQPTIADDGRRVSFSVVASDAVAVGEVGVVYVRDTSTGVTSVGSAGQARAAGGALSGDGRLLAWVAEHGVSADADPDLAAVHARAPGSDEAPQLISRPPGDAPFLAPAAAVEWQEAGGRRLSADGRFIVFTAGSRRLPAGNGWRRVYRRDLTTGAVELVSRDIAGRPAEGFDPTISADGSRVAFLTYDQLHPADHSSADVYLRDLAAATTTLVSRGDGVDGVLSDGDATTPRISADGRHVAWASYATTLTGAFGRHVYLRDVDGARTQLVDRASGAAGTVANGESEAPSISADGRYVAFLSAGNNLDPADGAPATDDDVYLRDTVAQTTELISRRDGADGAKAAGESAALALSDDGRRVAFALRGGLEPARGPGAWSSQVHLRDRVAGTTTLISAAADGSRGDGSSEAPSLSGDGRLVAFETEAANLPGSAPAGARRTLVRDIATGAWTAAPAFGGGDPGENWREGGRDGAVTPSLSADGRCLAFVGQGAGPAAGDAADVTAAYVLALADRCAPAPGGGGGGGGGGGQPGGPPHGGGPARPALTKVSLLRRRFRVGPRATARAAGAAPGAGLRARAVAPRRATAAVRRGADGGDAGSTARRRGRRGRRKARATPAGTAFRFTLGAPATVTIALQRKAAGRRAGRRCRPPARRLRGARRCVRLVAAGTLTRRDLGAGRRTVAFSGRVGRRALAPGRYRATLTARTGAGRSAPVRLAFAVVRR